MGLLAPKTDQGFHDEAFTRQHVMDKLGFYSEMRRQHDDGVVNATVSRRELSTFIDHWLDTLVEIDELNCTGDGCSLCAREA